jgi:hypothetical protein
MLKEREKDMKRVRNMKREMEEMSEEIMKIEERVY